MENKSLNQEIVESLSEDVKSLLKKLNKSIETSNDSNYKMLISNLKGTVGLIKELDWELKYSEYSKEVASNVYQKQIAIWEQNGEGNIRNHKIWDIKQSVECPIEVKDNSVEFYDYKVSTPYTNKKIDDILNKKINEMYQIKAGTNIFNAIKIFLGQYLKEDNYFIEESSQDYVDCCLSDVIRIPARSAIKEVLQKLLENTNGYFAFIQDGELVIRKGGNLIIDVNEEYHSRIK